LACALLLLGCSGDVPVERAAQASLPPGATASAGDELIAVATVERIAQRQNVSLSEALTRALSDALLASGARAALPRATVRSIERAAAARRLAEALASEAAAQGPPRAAELEELVNERWVELARPPAVQTVHAVVINTEPGRESAARAVAEKLAEAVHSALTAEAFVKAAQAVPADGFEIRAESLAYVTADGRAFQRRDNTFVPQPSYDPGFAAAANSLEIVGQQSPIVKTRFGFHVIRLEQRAPAAGIPESERAAVLAPEVMSRRASRARTQLLERQRKATPIELGRAVDELTSRVPTSP
jgi:parvulin-like peptidyl-prolyl isomerase